MRSALPLEPPQRLVRALRHGAQGPTVTWLAALPELLRERLERWELTPERVVAPGGRSSLVVLVRQKDGVPAVLKLPVPDPRTAQEPTALAHWDGWGAVRLLRTAPAAPSTQGATGATALLLERLRSEMSLRSLPEEKSSLEAVSVARRLWVPPPERHAFETVAQRTADPTATMRSLAPPEVRPLVDEAVELRDALIADSEESLLLHGDFRQGAVLAGGADRAPWLAVGPEPLVGERAYDLARLVRDRLHDLVASPGAAAAAQRRVTRLAGALEVDPARLRGWALFRAVAAGVRHLTSGDRADGEVLLEFASWL